MTSTNDDRLAERLMDRRGSSADRISSWDTTRTADSSVTSSPSTRIVTSLAQISPSIHPRGIGLAATRSVAGA